MSIKPWTVGCRAKEKFRAKPPVESNLDHNNTLLGARVRQAIEPFGHPTHMSLFVGSE
jgi:hypothetical protein